MKKNSFLTVFKFIIIPIYFLELLSFIIYSLKPSLFYFRAWEYFNDFVFPYSNIALTWEGEEQGDLSRKYLFYYNEKKHSKVSIDQYGFRKTSDSLNATILFAGDSTIFGSGLSDKDTLPWQFQQMVGLPVLNGGRTDLGNALKHPDATKVKIVFDCKTERSLHHFKNIIDEKFEPIAKRDEVFTKLKLYQISPHRYSFLSNLKRVVKRGKRDLKLFFSGGEQPLLFKNHYHSKHDLNKTISRVSARKKYVESLGMRYIVCPIPAKQSIYQVGDIKGFNYNFLQYLFRELKKRDIEYINLLDSLRAHKDQELLFDRYDTHWNRAGVKHSLLKFREKLDELDIRKEQNYR